MPVFSSPCLLHWRSPTASMKKNLHNQIPLHLITAFLLIQSISPAEFLFNGFNQGDMSLYGNATLDSKILTLTNDTTFSIGRSLYPSKITTKTPNSSFVLPFSTSFIFSIAPYKNTLPGHGFVFLFVPFTGIQGANSAQNLGFLNRTLIGNTSTHVFGIEFDVFKNEEFDDIDDNHVGIDVNSLTSIAAQTAGYWPDDRKGDDEKYFKKLDLNNGKNYQVWIDYADGMMNITMVTVGMSRPKRPLFNVSMNLSDVLLDEMYVGFTAGTGALVESHKILAWSFSNSNSSLSEALITTGLPNFELPGESIVKSTGFISGVTVGTILVFSLFVVGILCFVKRKRRKARERAEMEDWELEYWPHRITFQEIETATKKLSEKNVIGVGGNGNVYKGVLEGGVEVAVKQISVESGEGMREFLAEISSLGRLKHRNLVGLRGWCKKEKGTFMLVYDYMENGSLEKRLFECEENKMLSCQDRIKILKDVASGVLYLHEGWERKVLHRDIKSSNVLLDKEMKGRLGDFGLARMQEHGQVATTTRVVGTVGYLAPEIIRSGRASTQTDVYAFGVLILEVMCGKRPIEEGKAPLVDWVWQLNAKGKLVYALDVKLRAKGGYDEEEVTKILHLGLLCAYPDPNARPTMRQVVRVLDGKIEKNENGESETEDMDAYLLGKMNSQELWTKYPLYSGKGSHPTFEDIRDAISSSMSLSWSATAIDGSVLASSNVHGAELVDNGDGLSRKNVV